jgi:hypothetical protein
MLVEGAIPHKAWDRREPQKIEKGGFYGLIYSYQRQEELPELSC